MTKWERTKAWTKRNQDKIIVVGAAVLFVGFIAVVTKSTIDYQLRVDAELNGYIDELNALIQEAKAA